MARYWATSGCTRLSICVLLDGSISSPCSARLGSPRLCAPPRSRQRCADSSTVVTRLKIELLCEWAAVPPGLSLTAESGGVPGRLRLWSEGLLLGQGKSLPCGEENRKMRGSSFQHQIIVRQKKKKKKEESHWIHTKSLGDFPHSLLGKPVRCAPPLL